MDSYTSMKKGEIIELQIEKLAFGGKGIGRLETDNGRLVVFVNNTIPGQVVRCRVTRKKKKHIEAKLVEVLERSPDEVDRPFQTIPGAPYSSLPIEIQERYKKENSIDLLRRIGNIEQADEKFDEFISSPDHWHYRNKMEYSFAAIRYDLETGDELDDFALGFKHRGTWWMVENLDKDSGLFDEEFENKLHLIRKFCEESGIPPWHAPKREGFFRFLTVRKSFYKDQLLVNLVTSSSHLDEFDRKGFIKLLTDLFGDRLAGIIHTLNDDIGDRVQPLQGASQLVYGENFITESILGLNFEIKMESFFQTNPKSAERLYAKAIDYLRELSSNGDFIFDLFCGTGTISQLVAKELPQSKVVGVDIERSAIEDAIKSAKSNQVENVEFHAADVGKFLLEHPEYKGKIDSIIIDPPRAGIAPKSLKRIIELNADHLVYISCNPATLARDIDVLQESGYRVNKYSLIDQFPHTSHIEAVAQFSKNK
jgi:23S rRNA (uracil-5-)-methyltransferase RumA